MMVKLLIYHTGMCIKGPESWWIAESITPQLVVNQPKINPKFPLVVVDWLYHSWDCYRFCNPPTFSPLCEWTFRWIVVLDLIFCVSWTSFDLLVFHLICQVCLEMKILIPTQDTKIKTGWAKSPQFYIQDL